MVAVGTDGSVLLARAEREHVSMRLAAYILAVERVVQAKSTRGIYP